MSYRDSKPTEEFTPFVTIKTKNENVTHSQDRNSYESINAMPAMIYGSSRLKPEVKVKLLSVEKKKANEDAPEASLNSTKKLLSSFLNPQRNSTHKPSKTMNTSTSINTLHSLVSKNSLESKVKYVPKYEQMLSGFYDEQKNKRVSRNSISYK